MRKGPDYDYDKRKRWSSVTLVFCSGLQSHGDDRKALVQFIVHCKCSDVRKHFLLL
jgi:hypothetical protein